MEPGYRLDAFLAENFSDRFSRSKIQELIKKGNVSVGGSPVYKSSYKSEIPVSVEITYTEEAEYKLTGNDREVPILYQDEWLAVIHKPPGMTVHPGAGTKDDTLVHSLIQQIDQLSDGSEIHRPGIVHRLDRETEGLMIIAKQNNSHRKLASMFENREIKKEYTAWVWGITPGESLENGYIGRHPVQRKKMVFIDVEKPGFKEARLAYRRLEITSLFSKISIDLLTGRTHQIRATLAARGFPVFGDELYSRFQRRLGKSPLSKDKKEELIRRGLLLIANRISFLHPFTKQLMEYSLPLPLRFFNLE